MGHIYRDIGDNTQAIVCLKHSLLIAREVNYRVNEGFTILILGQYYESLSNIKQALDYYMEGPKIAQEAGNCALEGRCCRALKRAYTDNLSMAGEQYCKISLSIAKKVGV